MEIFPEDFTLNLRSLASSLVSDCCATVVQQAMRAGPLSTANWSHIFKPLWILHSFHKLFT